MDDDSEFQSQTFQLLGEDNNKFPPSLRSFALPKFDIDEHLQVHLRFDSLIDTEALLGIQGQDSNWIEDFSSGTTAIDFSSTAAECCSITRHNNVWSEAISSESVEILLKSVAEDEMIDKETSIMETDELNVLSGTGDQMDISLRQGNDHKSETGDIGQNVPALPPGKYPRNVSVVDESATGVQPQVEGDVRQSSGCITCMNTQGDPLYAFSNPSLGTGKLDIQSLSDQIVEEQTEISMPERSDLQSNDGQKETSHVTGRDDEVTEQYFNVAETMDCLSSGKGSFLEPIMNSMMLMDEGCNESGYSEKPDGLLEDIAYLIKGTSKENEAGDKSSAQSVGMSKPSNDMCSLTKEEDRSTVTQSGEIGSENLPIPSYATEHSKDVCYKQQDYDSNVNYFHVELPAQNAKINDDHGEEQLDSLMEVTEGKQYPEHDLTENRNSDIGSTSELALEMHANSETQMNKVEDEMGLETNTSSLKSQNLESAVIEKSSQVEAVEDEKSSQVEAVEDSEKPEIEFNASDAKSNDHPLHASLSVAVADVKITSPIANDMVGKKNLVPSTFPIVINVNNDDIIATGKAEDISAGWQNTDTVSVFADSAAKDLMQDGPVTGHALVGVDLISLKEHTIMQQSPPDASNIVDGILEQKRKDSNAQLPREPVTITDPVVAKDPPPKGELQIESGLKHVPLGNKSRDTSALEQKEEATPSSLALELVHSHEKQTAIPANVSLLHSERKIITLVSSGPVAIPVTGDHAPLDSTTKSQPIVYEKPSSYVDSSVSASCQDDPQSSVDKPTSHQSTKFVEGVLIVNDAALKQKGTSDLPAIISQGNDEITSTAAGVANNDVVQTLLEPPTAETGSANYHDKEQDASTITLSKRNAEARLSETVSGKPSAFEPNCGSPAVISCSEHPQDQEGSRVLSEQTSTVSNDGPLISSGAEENGNEVQLSARQVKESSVSEDDRSFTFEVGSLADISEKNTGNEWKPFPSMQSPELPKISKEKSHGSHIESKERKQGPRSKTPNSDKTNRLAVSSNESPTMPQGKFSKETSILKTPTDRDAGSCSVSSTSVATVNRDMDLEESRQYACSENSKMKTSCSPSVQTSSGLPDLNSSVVATAKIYQPFSDLQQVQLRAQIFVYGSLIQGISPDEACMVSAFGGTGGGRSPWEGVWRLSVERYQAQKSPFANSEIPRSAVRVPEKVTGCSSLPSKIFCTSTSQTSGKVVPSSIQNSTPPLPSPVWSVSTHDGLNANMPRGMRLDFNQALTPSHSYYSSQTRHFANKSTLWPSQSPRTGPQGFSVQGSTLTAAATQYSTVPIVETVKLTPVRDSTMSRAPNIQLVSPAALLPILSPASVTKSSVGKVETQGKTATPGTSKHASTIQKPRKRKKAGEPKELGLAIPISQSTTEPSSTIVTKAAPSPSAGLFTSSSTQNNVTCGTLLPTSPVILPAHCQVMNSNCSEQRAIFSEETSSRIEQAKLQAEEAAALAAASGRHSQDIWSQLAAQRDSGLVSEVEVKLASAAVAASTIQKPRKRKKAGEPKEFGLAIPISQSTTEPSSTIVTKAAPSPSSTQNNVTCGTLLLTSPVILPAHCQVMNSNSSEQRAIFSEEISSRIEQAKLQAEEAAALAAASVRHSQDIWSQLAAQRDSGLVSEVEVKLASAAVASSAAASVAKAAAAAAKVASDAALQAKMMADEILSLARTGNLTQSSEKIDGSSSVISAAREAARRRVEEASAATKRAENIDAIVKAAELAAEAVSQAGAIIAMGDPLPFNLSELIESGPEGFWKAQRPGSEKLNANNLPVTKDMGLNDTDHRDGLVKQSNGQLLNKKDIQQTVSEGEVSRNEQSVMLGGSYQEGGLGNAATVHNNRQENDSLSTNLKESDIQKGSFVEVVSDDDGLRGAWYSARVLDVKDMKAYVCHDYLLNDKGSGQLKEWVPLEGADDVAPRIRGTHPLATSEHEGTRKRRREAVGNYAWEVGDRVDAWMRDGWWEGIVTEKNQGDETKLTVHFPAGGDSSVVQAWNLRLSRIWKDSQWAEWSRTRENTLQPYEGDTPQEKRQKLNRPEARFDAEVDSRGIGNLSKKAPLEDSRKPEEPRPLNLSAKDKIFSVGRNARDDGVSDTNRVRRTGLQKEGSRVVFGVPKPGKKRKFMEVSKHYVLDNKTDKTREENDSLKFPRYLMPQQSRPWKNTSKVDPKGKQAGESKPRGLKTLKSQTSQIRSTTEKDTSSISTTSVSNAVDNGRSALPNSRVGIGDKCNLEKNPVEVVSFPSSVGTTASLPNSHVQAVPGAPAAKKKAATSKVNKPSRSEDKGSENFIKAMPDSIEPRRSNRRIQPTSRLLEGLQSSLIISKIPSFSQDKGARHRGTSSRGNTRG